jgi:RNA polymerase sigma-70 factor (ECF subfamily)
MSPGAGDPLVAELYHEHAAAILAYIRLRTSTREEAEDLLLDVFLAALEHHEVLEERTAATQRAWLRSVAAHKIADHYRRGNPRKPVTLDQVAQTLYADEAHSPESMALSHEEQERLHALLQGLPPLQQQVISLRFVYDMRCDEIADTLGKKESAVRKLLWRAVNLVRARYAEERGEGSL